MIANSEFIKRIDYFSRVLPSLEKARLDNDVLYYGGPLVSERNKRITWLQPILLQEGNCDCTIYHLIYINCRPNSCANAKLTPIHASDIDLLTNNTLNTNSLTFETLLEGFDGEPRILVRKCQVGNVSFPFISININDTRETDISDLKRIYNLLGSSDDHLKLDIDYSFFDFLTKEKLIRPLIVLDRFVIWEPRKVEIENQIVVNVYHVTTLSNDDWKTYQVFTKKTLSTETFGRETIYIRIDSRCDSGQLCRDSQCDCLQQFREGLADILDKGGLMIHIPTQDGRGYGTAPKMETENYKLGLRGIVKSRTKLNQELDTISAAIRLYRDPELVDLRTYEGVAELLKALGVRSVINLTNNKKKNEAIKSVGIKTKRMRHYTKKVPELAKKHIISKKEFSKIYYR